MFAEEEPKKESVAPIIEGVAEQEAQGEGYEEEISKEKKEKLKEAN